MRGQPGLAWRITELLCTEDQGWGSAVRAFDPDSAIFTVCETSPGFHVSCLIHRLLHFQRIKEMRYEKVNTLPHSLKVLFLALR